MLPAYATKHEAFRKGSTHPNVLMGTDVAWIGARGRLYGNQIRLEGRADTMPGAHFWANLTRLDDGALPPRGAVGPGGIANGLYGMKLSALDGVDAFAPLPGQAG
ncbi:hypothetical protein [Bradyrhizobium sp. CB1015]|uniref:hypothetical protein n=1 Tax=Bradyrhizobium sp. CB1015 TaxID=2976822 RepID=UPI0021AA6B3F|nr:hypothetical protein [Bradyrhizobium sp. CB1015]UWU88982.1 hypothetical protein N2604_20870 [Bradyrhizobium sp. CB1015]